MAACEVSSTKCCMQPIIDFDSGSSDYDPIERVEFWESIREWLSAQGYTLARRFIRDEYDDNLVYVPTHENPATQQHPYAPFWGGNFNPPNPLKPELSEPTTGKVMFAQDSLSRHVALKIVKDGSEEYRILRLLSEESSLLSVEDFPHIMPVLDFLKCDKHWFVVMPRWGAHPHLPWHKTVHEGLRMFHALLKAVAFLHERLIAHRDIRGLNTAVNHIATSWMLDQNTLRPTIRMEETFLYALFDFDISIMFSPNSSAEQRRLPYWDSWDGGSFDGPYDTAQGELDYDPFAFDVATLGICLALEFQQLTAIVPMLAPLFDKMLTWNVSCRFTASEALDFFETMYAQLTPAELASPFPFAEDALCQWKACNRWAGLPPDFIEKWESYRIPEPPLTTRILRKICERPRLHVAVVSIRRAARLFRNVLKLLFG